MPERHLEAEIRCVVRVNTHCALTRYACVLQRFCRTAAAVEVRGDDGRIGTGLRLENPRDALVYAAQTQRIAAPPQHVG